ncbi:FYN-binding protein 1 isoform X2 [Nerophis lumbriciformis]|uniref:FYN-binding protein 1 isoform X2 n=1 Tax=Nerophis lumbriciformis TaxID=546530 RepID=UPI003BAA37A5
MEERVDVKALRARFNNKVRTSPTYSSPRLPQSRPEKNLLLPSGSPPTALPHVPGLDAVRFQTEETMAGSKPAFSPLSPPIPGIRTSVQSSSHSKVKQTGQLLEKLMLRNAAGAKIPFPAPTSTPLPLRQRRTDNTIPLRRPLPPEGPRPLKPKRPPNVNLESFQNVARRAQPLPALATREGFPDSGAGEISLPAIPSPSYPSPQSIKPRKLQNQVIALDQVGVNWDADKNNGRQDLKKKMQIKNELRTKFQLQDEEILHTAIARHDWYEGGKRDLKVHQGERVEILRVKDNPQGKWLARSLDGKYGYISNTCVDIDYEAVKSMSIQSPILPPLPPDPPQKLHMEPSNSLSHCQNQYDRFHLSTEDFPPSLPEISIDPKVEKELRKKYKYEGPLRVMHTMMVDPNGVMKKPRRKDLHVTHGEVLDVIQLTNSKKALCHNRASGKSGYVSRNLLLPFDGDIYDDIDNSSDRHANDSLHTDY